MRNTLLALLLALYSANSLAGFDVVALGVEGGLSADNLSSYLIRTDKDARYVALDAGSVLNGIARGLEQGSFPDVTPEKAAPLTPQGYVFREQINSYFVSHAHLDHVAGLILASPQDSRKTIYTTANAANTLRTHYFNWKSWPNFSDSGGGDRLGTYRINSPRFGQRFTLGLTGISGVIYPLSHGASDSSMLLMNRVNDYFAYFGDSGSDAAERSKNLDAVWQVLGSLVAQKQLKGMIIEASYPNETPAQQLHGHLTPALLLAELKRLETYAGGEGALRGLPIVITHIKPTLTAGEAPRELIRRQLEQGNNVGADFIFMQQGERRQF